MFFTYGKNSKKFYPPKSGAKKHPSKSGCARSPFYIRI